jgi:hypothetical protein
MRNVSGKFTLLHPGGNMTAALAKYLRIATAVVMSAINEVAEDRSGGGQVNSE